MYIAPTVRDYEMLFLPLPYTIITNQSISEPDNQTVKVPLVQSLDQVASAYPANTLVCCHPTGIKHLQAELNLRLCYSERLCN